MKSDITSRTDIEKLVNEFYNLVQNDPLIGHIFNDIIKDKWPEHLSKMYRFWETVLLNNHTYNGAPFFPHATLPLHKEHFDQWLSLFRTTVNTFFEGPKAKEAIERADKMALMFLSKINYIRDHNSFKPLM